MHLTAHVLVALAFLTSACPAYSASTIVDGDTLVIDGKQVELWGIVAPQKSETCKTSAGNSWPCGQSALQQLQQLAADETFACAPKEPGFVICQAGGLDVARLLVKEGLAWARQDYHDAESRAREAKVGIWE